LIKVPLLLLSIKRFFWKSNLQWCPDIQLQGMIRSLSLALPIEKRELAGSQAQAGLAREWWEFYNWVVYKDGQGPKY